MPSSIKIRFPNRCPDHCCRRGSGRCAATLTRRGNRNRPQSDKATDCAAGPGGLAAGVFGVRYNADMRAPSRRKENPHDYR